LLGYNDKDSSWPGRTVQQSSIVAAIHAAAPHLLATLRASGDLTLPSDHGEKRLLRMLFVSQLTLASCYPCGGFPEQSSKQKPEELTESKWKLTKFASNCKSFAGVFSK
jgi:hypothetical protein